MISPAKRDTSSKVFLFDSNHNHHNCNTNNNTNNNQNTSNNNTNTNSSSQEIPATEAAVDSEEQQHSPATGELRKYKNISFLIENFYPVNQFKRIPIDNEYDLIDTNIEICILNRLLSICIYSR